MAKHLSRARTPTYKGRESDGTSWSKPTLQDYRDGLDLGDGQWGDLSREDKQRIVEHTLIGSADAESFDDANYFPVVNPRNSHINATALRNAISRAPQTDLPQSTIDSIQAKARSLLDKEYGASDAARGPRPQAKVLEDGTLMLFGVIGDDGSWTGQDDLTAATIVEQIRNLGKVDEIQVLINSPGGYVDEGLAIYHELATNPANVVITVAGVAASMASAIAMAGNVVRIAENGVLMIHDPWGMGVGSADELRKAAEILDTFGESLAGIYAKKTGLDRAKVEQMMADETWISAQEALDMGFADELSPSVAAQNFTRLRPHADRLKGAPDRIAALIRGEAPDPNRDARRVGAEDKDAGAGRRDDQARSNTMVDPKETNQPAAAATTDTDPAGTPDVSAATEAGRKEGREASRAAAAEIKSVALKTGLGADWALGQIEAGATAEEARAAAIDALAERQEAREKRGGPSNVPSGVVVEADERDKYVEGASNWLIVRSGNRRIVEAHTGGTIEAGEFRGLSLLDMARDSLERQGIRTRGMGRMQIAGAALGVERVRAEGGLQTTSDFPVLLENALNKILRSAYAIQADTWRRFCATGTVVDFRPHPRLRLGSLGALDKIMEDGEFRRKHFNDAEKESIQASTYGNIVGIDRQAIVNDDVDGFMRLTVSLGRAAGLSIEVKVYAVLAENSGLGPTMADGNTLFHASHSNIASTSAAPSTDSFDAARVLMGSQLDQDGNEVLDLRPYAWVGPASKGGAARVVNSSQWDPSASVAQIPNKVQGILSEVVDTSRLTGTRWYMFADPTVAPCLEVVFLEGEENPVLETELGFEYDGVRYRVRHDFGVDATDYRPAVTNAGA